MANYNDIPAAVHETVMDAVAADLIRSAAGNISVRTYDVEIDAQAYHQARQIGDPLEITPEQRQEIIDTNYG